VGRQKIPQRFTDLDRNISNKDKQLLNWFSHDTVSGIFWASASTRASTTYLHNVVLMRGGNFTKGQIKNFDKLE